MDARLAGPRRRAADRAGRRSAPPDRRGRHLPPVRDPGPRHPRPAPAAPHGARPRRDRRRAEDARPTRSPTISTSCARASASRRSSSDELTEVRDAVRHAAPDRDRRLRRRLEDEDLIAREDMVVTVSACRLRQARAALDLPGAAARRQGPLRHGDARRGFRHPAVRRQHPHAGAVLLQPGPGLQGEGLAPADRRAERPRQGAGQHAAAAGHGRAHHHDHAAARGRGVLGDARRDVRHRAAATSGATSCPTSSSEPQRQDRHEAR